jgi:predicted Fe-Mo cluster-binding NifX family protein
MSHRIAFASSDGKYIDTHFGHADRFIIVDVSETSYAVAETRTVEPVCDGQDEQRSFDRVGQALSDCEAVFVSRIGRAAAQALFVKGIRVFEAPFFIEDVLNLIISDRLLDHGTPFIA